jgi:hypothetical protein
LADVYGDATDVVAAMLDLAGVDAGSDLQAERPDRLLDRLRAADRSRRAIEGGQHAITGRLDLSATVPVQLTSNDSVVTVQKLRPMLVSQARSDLGGANDVGEQHSRQHPAGFRRREPSGEKLFDRVEDRVDVPDEEDRVRAGTGSRVAPGMCSAK